MLNPYRLPPAATNKGRCSKVCSRAQQHKERLESESLACGSCGGVTARLRHGQAEFIHADCVTLESSIDMRQGNGQKDFYSHWSWFMLKTVFSVLGFHSTGQHQNEWILPDDAASKMSVKMAYRMRIKLYLQHADTVFFFFFFGNAAEALFHPLLVAASADLQLLSSTLVLVRCHRFSHSSLKRLSFNF